MHLSQLVLDPVVSRVDLANQVEPLLLLCLRDGARLSLLIVGVQRFIVDGLFPRTLHKVLLEGGPFLRSNFIAKPRLNFSHPVTDRCRSAPRRTDAIFDELAGVQLQLPCVNDATDVATVDVMGRHDLCQFLRRRNIRDWISIRG